MQTNNYNETTTLGIDYGSSKIGIALVRNSAKGNKPLFAATITVSARDLKEKTENRAGLRRLRRTRKTKKRRLKALKERLSSLGVEPATVLTIVRFSERRGYKSLFDEEGKPNKSEAGGYRISREEFFFALEKELEKVVPVKATYQLVLAACEDILNRFGQRSKEIRPLRIDNRGVSKCSWEGCENITPRRINAVNDALMQQLVTFFQGVLRDNSSAVESVKTVVRGLGALAPGLRKAVIDNESEKMKNLRSKVRMALKNLRSGLELGEASDPRAEKAWKTLVQGILGILEKGTGRNAYCREHSSRYIDHVLRGKAIPFKNDIADSDIISRREQIAFNKLWRYIEARLLPLAPQGVDRIVVERTAFDVLSGSRKKKASSPENTIEEIYQQGPRFGFKSDREMLAAEFGNLCAYCGQKSDQLIDREHILPRKDFFFDGYLNILPSCPKCNAEKGTRLPGAASLCISSEAYANYEKYLGKLKIPHFLHHEKKGILNLMRDPQRSWEVERYLSLIANNLAATNQSGRGPRPFARFLFSKLSTIQEKKPKIVFQNGRRTALYRHIAFSAFDKSKDKELGSGLNHAVDAVLLACVLPSPAPLEERGLNVYNIGKWVRSVRAAAPEVGSGGIPKLPAYDHLVPGFELVNEDGYVELELATMNWNQKDSSTHKQDPYGWSEHKSMPIKRCSAKYLYDFFKDKKNSKKMEEMIDRIHHPGLRQTMMEALRENPSSESVAGALKQWLQKSVKNGLKNASWSSHPADLARKRDLEEFANGEDPEIPQIIGVRRLDTGVRGKIDWEKRDPETGKILGRYSTQPSNRAVVLAYPKGRKGEAVRTTPARGYVRHNLALWTSLKKFGPKPPELADGIVFGRTSITQSAWKTILEKYLCDCGFHSYVVLTRCCVLCYMDGTKRFLRNFDENSEFKPKILKNIKGILRTPFSSKLILMKELTSKDPLG